MFSSDDDEHGTTAMPTGQDSPPAWSAFFDSRAEIDAFVQIAEQGSFQQAAHCLGLSIISLRRLANRIERHQGERLFRRDGGVVCLTGAGERLYAVARLIPGATRAGRPDQISGRGVRLAIDEPLTHDLLRRGLMTYLRTLPHARLQLHQTACQTSHDEEADICVRLCDPQPLPELPGHQARLLGRLRLMPFVGRRHGGRQATLADAPLVHYQGFDELVSLADWHALLRQRAGGVVEVASSDLLRECVLWGGGVGLMPHYTHLIHRELTPVSGWLPELPPLDVLMMVRQDVMTCGEVSAVVQMLEQVYADRREWLIE